MIPTKIETLDPTERPTLVPSELPSHMPSEIPSELPSEMPSDRDSCPLFEGTFEPGQTIFGRHKDDSMLSFELSCPESLPIYEIENTDIEYDVHYYGPITPVYNTETCVKLSWQPQGTCEFNVIYLAYSDEYDPDDQAANFLGYADPVYGSDDFFVRLPAGSALHFVTETFFPSGGVDLPCTVSYVIDAGDC